MKLEIAKFFTGTVLILLALWIIIGEQVTGASSNAVINARLATIRSPIEGTLRMPINSLRKEFYKDETFGRVDNVYFDTSSSSDLQWKRSNLLSEVASDLSPDISTMTKMRFPVNLTGWRSQYEEAVYRRTDH